MTDHLKDPQAVSWGDLAEDFALTDAEKGPDSEGGAGDGPGLRFFRRLAESRKPQHPTQVQAAEAMDVVTRARVSRIEKGQRERSEVDILAAYVKALGGKLKIVADFGDESYVLG
jgi:hypothetical protein